MSKYDCSKTVDYAHEYKRMCDSFLHSCSGCPLRDIACTSFRCITEEHTALVQKWSDEHPEKPKLTKEERAFIEGLNERTSICGLEDGGLWLQYYSMNRIPIKMDWFAFIDTGDEWKVSDLLKLEVEDE